ncbi:MAG: hypothetical protein H0T89_24440 [Deltaproteobacteria bacterium]|nr:hypothetical protein [Deltaproteobacteria bacterium]MDQ3300112.1 hypothetical protein [Myxococcota bacterium]
MPLRIMLLALVLAACSQPATRTNTSSPDRTETPPTTNDPGATQDTTAMPPLPPPPETGGAGPTASTPTGAGNADGAACLDSSECASGTCEGLGCSAEQPGKCMPRMRACTRDLRTYCGCDGKTFQASGSCPLRRYSAKSECKGS